MTDLITSWFASLGYGRSPSWKISITVIAKLHTSEAVVNFIDSIASGEVQLKPQDTCRQHKVGNGASDRCGPVLAWSVSMPEAHAGLRLPARNCSAAAR